MKLFFQCHLWFALWKSFSDHQWAFMHSQFRSILSSVSKSSVKIEIIIQLELHSGWHQPFINSPVVLPFFLSFYPFSTKLLYFSVDLLFSGLFFLTICSLVNIKKIKLHAAIIAITVTFFTNFKRKSCFSAPLKVAAEKQSITLSVLGSPPVTQFAEFQFCA